jgi:hypothetical protein
LSAKDAQLTTGARHETDHRAEIESLHGTLGQFCAGDDRAPLAGGRVQRLIPISSRREPGW